MAARHHASEFRKLAFNLDRGFEAHRMPRF
jgi:hypothetical protein